MTTDQRTAATYLAALLLTGIAAAGLHVMDGFSRESLDFTLRASGFAEPEGTIRQLSYDRAASTKSQMQLPKPTRNTSERATSRFAR